MTLSIHRRREFLGWLASGMWKRIIKTNFKSAGALSACSRFILNSFGKRGLNFRDWLLVKTAAIFLLVLFEFYSDSIQVLIGFAKFGQVLIGRR